MSEQIVGRTHFAGLFELIQVCAIHRRDVALTITQKGKTARILMQQGELRDAMCPSLRGEDAIYAVFAWVDSFFELAPLAGPVEHTITGSNTDIVMKAAEQTAAVAPPPVGPGDRIAGSLEVLSPTELLQLFEINCRNALLTLRNRRETGSVHLRDGRAIHATVGEREGDRAVLDLLTWGQGDFVVQFSKESAPETVLDSISGLVLEGSRRVDLLDRFADEEQRTWEEVAVQTLRQLEEGQLDMMERVMLAHSYQPPGARMAVADLLELARHSDEVVRREALESIVALPPAVLRALLEDKNTPNAVRYRISPEMLQG
ncbi:MAG: DUF4388 domain-containing protein [Planctomycetes bacterium]|nr:DUF4388 domain-containing protein [Planctomycetota bacterium]